MEWESTTITWIWVGSGFLFIFVELFFPGLVMLFLGLASLTIALMRFAGYVPGFMTTFTIWFFLSLLYVLFLRNFVAKIFPSDEKREVTEEDLLIYGKEVTVVKQLNDENMEGRVRYSGTEWPAQSYEGSLEPGEKGTILHREGIGFIIKKQ